MYGKRKKTSTQISLEVAHQLRYQARKEARREHTAASTDVERAEVIERFMERMKKLKGVA